MFMQTDKQENSNDCGVHSIANATALAFGEDPSEVTFLMNLKCGLTNSNALKIKGSKCFPTPKREEQKSLRSKNQNALQYIVLVECRHPVSNTNVKDAASGFIPNAKEKRKG
ncbi:hypothetical protein HOLleu_43861 [Holothuria leucospilota]|uniref:Ubiquitin-like protease family profile domain-containing protein n=1 Tax=Holothuria leucospilota TaxID=206669 RepID=A0A9Q0YDY7_HOLLE|nr:hypothetical protein HOLleu_43861 [Holothuria leucospilota]